MKVERACVPALRAAVLAARFTNLVQDYVRRNEQPGRNGRQPGRKLMGVESKLLGEIIGQGVGDAIGIALTERDRAAARNTLQGWIDYAAKLESANAQWKEYGQKLAERVLWLEQNLKRQSANRVALRAVKDMLLEELRVVADPEKCKGLDPAKRQKLFDEKYNAFMAGDDLV